MMLGMSQEKLGENLGITFQQIQKYEKGTNRIGASRLQAIASMLSCRSPSSSRMRRDGERQRIRRLGGGRLDDLCRRFPVDSPKAAAQQRLRPIKDAKVRRKVIDLVKALAAEDDD